ncbi:MAG TPA: hypothetical protein VIT41_18250 [Microlunatus sp.]
MAPAAATTGVTEGDPGLGAAGLEPAAAASTPAPPDVSTFSLATAGPATVGAGDFFRPRRSSSESFLGGGPPAAPLAAVGGVGAGPGCGDGTGEADAAELGTEGADPRGADGPEEAEGGGGPAGGVADDADRAEYAELAE